MRHDDAQVTRLHSHNFAMVCDYVQYKSMTKTEQTQVLIAADEEARHKQVLSVLNAVREAGIEKVSFESKKTPPN